MRARPLLHFDSQSSMISAGTTSCNLVSGGVTFIANCEVTRSRPITSVDMSWGARPFGEVAPWYSLEVSLPSSVSLV